MIADRTACSILTLFIVIATSRPLNKKTRSLSVRGSNNYCGSASTCGLVHSLHTCTVHGTGHCWQTSRASSTLMPASSLRPWTLWRFSLRFFVVHFVAKRYILQQKCLKGRIGTCMLGTRWNNFLPCTPTLRATMHRVTDRQTDWQTDRQTDKRMMPIADHTV